MNTTIIERPTKSQAHIADVDRYCHILAVDINNLFSQMGGPVLSQEYLTEFLRKSVGANSEVAS